MAENAPTSSNAGEQASNTPPFVQSAANAQTRLIIDAVSAHLTKENQDNKHDSNLKYILLALSAGFLILAGMIIGEYRWLDERITSTSSTLENRIEKTDDRVVTLGTSATRIDQKLQDLLERIPPVAGPPPKK